MTTNDERQTKNTRITRWLVPGIALASLLVVGLSCFAFLLVAMNGFSEAAAWRVLIVYFVLLLTTTIFAVGASRWSLQTLTARTDWPFWVQALLALSSSVIVSVVILFVCTFIALMLSSFR